MLLAVEAGHRVRCLEKLQKLLGRLTGESWPDPRKNDGEVSSGDCKSLGFLVHRTAKKRGRENDRMREEGLQCAHK